MISDAMWTKAQAVIAADSRSAYLAAGNRQGRKHRPYALPARAEDLVRALGRNDAEAVSAILLFRPNSGQ